MSRPVPGDPLLIRVSQRAYNALLTLYPPGFRRDYGHHMTQVFRDVCRDALRGGGVTALLMWWGTALFDLIRSVIEQHRKDTLAMSKTILAQTCGWLLILGGLLMLASGALSLVVDSSDMMSLSRLALVPALGLISAGLLGMYFRFTDRIVLFGRIALIVSIAGAFAASIGWLATLLQIDNGWYVFIFGWLTHLIGQTVFAGYAASEKIMPRVSLAMLIGSALPLTLVMLSLTTRLGEESPWLFVGMVSLVGLGWIVTGWGLNRVPSEAARIAPSL